MNDIERKIAILEELILLHTTGWDELGIRAYDQDRLPSLDSVFWGVCGCCVHTLKIANKEQLGYEIGSYLNLTEYDFIFGMSLYIKIAAEKLGFEVPTSFTREDLVVRCNMLIQKYKGELK